MKNKDIFFIFSCALMSFFTFLPQYVSDKIIGWLDMMYYFIPFKEIIIENLREGVLPLWNPYIYCGQPLLANLQSAVFYPLNIFYYAFQIDIAFKINTLIIYFIMSAFLYKLFRHMELSEEASFISAFLFSFTAYMTIRAAEWADLHTIAWMPAAIYFSWIAIDKNRAVDNVLAVVALAMSFLSGHPQVFIYVFILYTCMFFYRSGINGFKKYITYIISLFFITSLQILPTIEFVSFSSRASEYRLYYDTHSTMYMNFDHLIQIIFPFIKKFFLDYSRFINWMALIDIGIIALLLAIFGMITFQNRKVKIFFLVLFTIAFAFSFLDKIPYYSVWYEKLVFLHFFRYPAKINIIFFFVMCFFAGVGFDLIFKRDSKVNVVFLKSVIFVNIILIFIFLFLYYGKIAIIRFYIRHFEPDANFDNVLNKVYSYDIFLNDAMIFLVVLFLFMSLSYIIIYKGINNNITKIILMIFIFVNTYIYNQPNYGDYVKYNDFNGETKISKFISQQKDINNKRILAPLMNKYFSNTFKKKDITVAEKYDFVRSTLQPNIPMFYRYFNMDGFDSLIIASTYDFIIKINKFDSPWDNSFFSLLSTKYILSVKELKGKTIKKIFYDDWHNMYLFQKKDVPDIVYFVSLKNAVYTDDKDEEFNELYKKKYDYDKKIVINKKYIDKFSKYISLVNSDKPAEISFFRKNINKLVINITNKNSGFAVISENFYPGWQAKVNGIKSEIIKVNGFLKGIFLEKGSHLIELEYKPAILYVGYVISIIFILFLLAGVLFRRKYEGK